MILVIGHWSLIRYAADQGRHPVERVLWIFLCLTGFGLAFVFLAPSILILIFNSGEIVLLPVHCLQHSSPPLFLSHLVLILTFNNRFLNLFDCSSIPHFSGLDKYMNDPTTTGLETTDYPIWNIDFPGVTICPNTKVKKRNISRWNSCPSSWLQASSRLH